MGAVVMGGGGSAAYVGRTFLGGVASGAAAAAAAAARGAGGGAARGVGVGAAQLETSANPRQKKERRTPAGYDRRAGSSAEGERSIPGKVFRPLA
jgi:hypothetical protein